MIKINPNDWINSHKGKIYDIDGAAGIQCVDLYKIFLKDIGYPNPARPIGGDGYADNIWYNRNALGLSPYFNFVTGQCKVGDIVIWAKGSPECPYSHVAMFVKDDPANPARGIFLGSNQGYDHSPGVFTSISMAGSLGALRYKGFTTNTTTTSKPTQTPSKPSTSGSTWVQDTILKVGDRVKSVSCAIAPWPGTNNAIKGNLVYVPALGGGVPLDNVTEASDTKDGKKDNILSNTNARVTLDECTVQKLDVAKDLAYISFGYWVKCGPLMAKR